MLSQTSLICSSVASDFIAMIMVLSPRGPPTGWLAEMTSNCLGARITSKHADALGGFGKMGKRPLHSLLVLIADHVEIKRIFPRTSFYRPRFDLCKIDVSQRKHSHCAKQ